MRSVNRVGALLLALALLGCGLLTAVEAALAAFHEPALLIDRDGWYHALTGTRFGAPIVRTVAIVVTAAGLLILFVQLRRWAPDRLAVRVDDQWYVRRRSAERRLAHVAEDVPGVARVRVRIRRNGPAWQVRIHGTGNPDRRSAVVTAVGSELDRLAAPPRDRVDVDLTPPREPR